MLSENNNNIQKLLELREQVDGDLHAINRTIKQLSALKLQLENKNSNYIQEVVSMIEDAVAFAVNHVLPFRKYSVSLEYVPYRNNGQLRLYLVDENGVKLPPRIIEGDMLNQVLSFASVTHITYQMGYRYVFYDEAFASANVRSLVLINSLIAYYQERGIRFVLVSQSPVLYAGLERRMIELVTDGKKVTEVIETDVGVVEEELQAVQLVTEMFDLLTKGGKSDEQ